MHCSGRAHPRGRKGGHGTRLDLRSTRVGHDTTGEGTRKPSARRAVLRILPEVVGSPSRNVVAKSEKAAIPTS